jgi:hypothetical protein
MYASVRRYLDVPAEFVVEMERREGDVKEVLRSVPGLVHYDLVRTRDGVFALMVCRDENSAIEAGRRAAAWMQAHIPGFGAEAPDVWAGPVFLSVPCDDMGDPANDPAKEGAKR